MKAIIPIISILLLCSCSRYLQIIQIQGKENISTKEDKLTYEDSNCKISYNFWYEGGLSGFEFHNKTDQMIKIDFLFVSLSRMVMPMIIFKTGNL